MRRVFLIASLALLATLGGCAKLGLNAETAKVDGKRYLFYRPWIHYEVYGSGPPMVLIHDFLTDGYTWRRNVEELGEYFQVFTLDLPGFGDSVNPVEAYTLEYYSASVGLFLREMEFGGAILVGHGMGAAVALDTYLRFPDRVKSVVVIDSIGFDEKTELLARDEDRIGLALHNSREEPDMERLRREVLEATLPNLYVDKELVSKELIDYYMGRLEKQGIRDTILGTLNYFHTDGLMRRLIEAETDLMETRKMDRRGERLVFIIWGAEDPWYPPRTAEYFRARIPRSKVAIIRGAGHFPHEEKPEVVDGLLIDALLQRPAPGNPYTVDKYDASLLLAEGRKLKKRKRYDEAKAKFKQAIELNPYLGVAYYEIGDILFREKQYAEAIEMLKESLRIYPLNAQVHYRLATTYHNQATDLRRKWQASGMDEDFIEMNTSAMMAKAIKHYEEAGRIDPSFSNPWFNLGRIYEQAGDYKAVARVYGKLADANPKNLRVAKMYVNALLKAKDIAGAVKAIEKIEKRIKSEKSKAVWPAWRGKLLMDLGKWDEAVAAWRRATDLAPADGAYQGYYAMALLEAGKLEAAREALELALASDGGNPLWHSLAASLDEREGKWESAVEHYRKALAGNPDDTKAAAGLARALVKLGKPKDAAKILDPLLASGRDDPELLVARARAHVLAAARLKGNARKAKEMKAEIEAAMALLKKAYDKGYDCYALRKDPDFASVKREKVFRSFRPKVH